MIAQLKRTQQVLALSLMSALAAPVRAQLSAPLPALPPLPSTVSPELQTCVARFGHSGCASRIYARILCDTVGQWGRSLWMEQQLEEQYEQAGIEFRGITAEQVETTAVRYYAPMLCPAKSPQIRQLFNPS